MTSSLSIVSQQCADLCPGHSVPTISGFQQCCHEIETAGHPSVDVRLVLIIALVMLRFIIFAAYAICFVQTKDAQTQRSCCLTPRHNSAVGVSGQRGRGPPQRKSTSERPIKLHKYLSSEHKLSSIGAASVLHNLKCKHWFLMLRRIMDMF